MRVLNKLTLGCIAVLMWMQAALAAPERDKITEFLEITGFDVALESIRLSAGTAPMMLGLDKDDFGAQWNQLTQEVFQPGEMEALAVEILHQTLPVDLLTHANAFYSSDLGQRIVAAENAAHMIEDDDAKSEAGEAIVDGLTRLGSGRVDDLRRMTSASDSAGVAIRAMQEIQVRFLMAAAAAGVVELRMDESDLRAALQQQEDELRRAIETSALTSAAYTYQAFSDAEVTAYADALEHPKMQRVYELMNAVQYEIMANRFEALAAAMARLQPSTDL